MSTVVPPVAGPSGAMRPPSASTRSWMPTMPDPAVEFATPAVVADGNMQDVALLGVVVDDAAVAGRVDGGLDMDERGVGAVGRVGQRLRDDVVGGDLNRLGSRVSTWMSTCTGTGQRRASAVTAGRSPLSVRTAGWTPRAISRSSSSAPARPSTTSSSCCAAGNGTSAWTVRSCRARERPAAAEFVVQVALDTPAGGIRGGDDPRARRGQCRPRLSVGRGGHELGESAPGATRRRPARRSPREDATMITPPQLPVDAEWALRPPNGRQRRGRSRRRRRSRRRSR